MKKCQSFTKINSLMVSTLQGSEGQKHTPSLRPLKTAQKIVVEGTKFQIALKCIRKLMSKAQYFYCQRIIDHICNTSTPNQNNGLEGLNLAKQEKQLSLKGEYTG